MKNCIIIHGCPDSDEVIDPNNRTYDKHWMPWLKKELGQLGISTEIPLMPEPWKPDYAEFKKEFDKYDVNDETTLIGHSCGCAFLVRWLGETKRQIDKLILVAPWKIPEKGNLIDEKFYVYPIDKTITERVGVVVMFTSDNEEADGKESLKIYQESLGGMIVELKGHGHFVTWHMGTEEFPELLDIALYDCTSIKKQ